MVQWYWCWMGRACRSQGRGAGGAFRHVYDQALRQSLELCRGQAKRVLCCASATEQDTLGPQRAALQQ